MGRIILSGFSNISYDELDIIDHIDTIRDHNSLSNLRNGTHKENMNNPLTRLHLSNPVSRIDMHTFEIKSYSSQIEAEEANGISISGGLKICCEGKVMTMGGYIWSWKGKEKERIEKFLKDIENPNKNMPSGYWNLDTLKFWANKLECTKIIHFHDRCEGGYEFARSNNLLSKIFPNKLQKYPRGWWDNLDHVLKAARECKNKQELIKRYPGANRAVSVHGWKDKLIFRES